MAKRAVHAAALALALLWIAATPAQNGRPAIEQILRETDESPALEKNLRVLCDEIGGRLPGTPSMSRAVSWASEAFRQAGLTQVRTETFGIPNSWAEGNSRAEVLEPVQFRAHVAAVGWSPATPSRGIDAEVIDAGAGEDGITEKLGPAGRGKIWLIRSQQIASLQDLAMAQRRATVALREAEEAGAAAVLLLSTRPRGLLYRHINIVDGRLDKLPAAVVAREEGERLLRLIESGHKVRMRLELPNKTGGSFQAENVVAEIRGGERPDEVIILGAHLDSWDLGTGCLDNACNAALVIEAARAIHAVRPPRRTVRFILFSGEEQGLLGSRAYVEKHRDEMDNVVAVIVHDIGTGRISGYSLGGRKDVEQRLSEVLAPLESRGVRTHTQEAFFGSDHFDFLLQGIPTLVANQDTTDYIANYHAESDTFDKVDLTQLRQQAGIAAVAAYSIADRERRLARRQTRAEIEELLRDTNLDDQMKFLDLWEDWQSGRRGRRR